MWKEFFEQVHAGYMQALDMPHIRSRVVHIDGTGSIADVHTRIVDILHTI
jgi:thymidylate kinase